MKHRIISLIILIALSAFFLVPVQAYSLDSSSAQPSRIFACQGSVIAVNLTGVVDSITVYINSTTPVILGGQQTSSNQVFEMVDTGGGVWKYTYGNNNLTLYGNKTVSFLVVSAGMPTYFSQGLYLYVYSDKCVGTDMTSYQNVSSGLGKYTNRFYTGELDIIGLALAPWLVMWGYLFYIIMIFWTSSLVYLKNQNVIQPLIILSVSLGALAATTWIPPEFKQYIVLIMALALGGMFYKIFKS